MKKFNFAGAREWKDEFSFLAKNGLDNLYLMLLAMAGSKSEIRRLHGLLDANVKLMRPDLIKLENFWEKYVFSEGKISSQRANLDQETLRWLFKTQCGGKNNSKYYFDYLNSRTVSTLSPFQLSDNRVVISTEKRIGIGIGLIQFYDLTNFYAEMFNYTFMIECFASNDGSSMTIFFVIGENDLTEEATHRLSQMPGYITREGLFYSSYLVINVPFGRKQEFLEEYFGDGYPGGSYYLPKNEKEFAGYLKDRLIESGVPLTRLEPFLI